LSNFVFKAWSDQIKIAENKVVVWNLDMSVKMMFVNMTVPTRRDVVIMHQRSSYSVV